MTIRLYIGSDTRARSDEEDGEESQEEDLSHFRLDNLPEDPFGECPSTVWHVRAARRLTRVINYSWCQSESRGSQTRRTSQTRTDATRPLEGKLGPGGAMFALHWLVRQKVEEKKLAREKFKLEKARKEEERKKAAAKQERRR